MTKIGILTHSFDANWIPQINYQEEDMNNNVIDDTTEEKHIIVIKDGDTILSEQELIPWIAIVLPTAPTKAWYTFDGRDWLPTDGKSIDENLTVEICSACHPFYTGQQKILDSEGRVERFKKRYEKK